MLLALGFLTASLLALLLLPAVWARAVRLSTRRLEMQLPLSMGEIVAERDQLRAEFATEARRLEQRSERLAEQRAHDMSEIGRQSTVIAEQAARVATLQQEIAALSADLSATRAALATTATELSTAHQLHWDAIGQIEEGRRRLDAARDRYHDLEEVADDRRATIATLETRIAGLDMRLHSLQGIEQDLRRDVADKAAAMLKAMDERDFAKIEVASAIHKRDMAVTELAARDARIAELEEAHRSERRSRSRAEKAKESGDRLLDSAKIDEAALRAAHERQLATLREAQDALSQQIEDLRARNASLEGALGTARRDQSPAAPAPFPLPRELADENARLRQAISDVGSDVSRLVAALNARAALDPEGEAPVDARMRDLQLEAKRTVSAR
jgi:chromosome segregation ATPase